MARNTDAADDLHDDFDLDDSFVESAASPEPETKPKKQTDPEPKKRKQASADTSASTEPKAKAKAKRHKNNTEPKRFSVPSSLPDQCTVWNTFMRKAYPNLTQLEIEDIALQPPHMYSAADSNEKEPSPTSPTFIEDLVKTALSKGKGKNKVAHAAPQVLIVCSSALRVIELVKRLRPVSKRPVAKLFSRHIKIDEQKKMLKESAIDIAVGTPNRVVRLLKDQDLRVNRLKLVAIDCWQDDKMRVVVDMDDTRSDLFAIWRDVLLPASKNPDYNFKLRLI
ncbi:cms1 ribosomal small subunit [Coemansia sp. RSA 2618]|nr:cms1 ribosomal small subunit [Coemansia sp. RSA 2618]